MSELFSFLSSALLDRGFLIETVGQDIYLTDNAYLHDYKSGSRLSLPAGHDQSDSEFLREMLEQLDLGGLKRTSSANRPLRLDAGDQRLVPWQVEKLFCSRHVQRESGGNLFEVRPSNFKRRMHGQKISVAVLDTHVALLVKGLSAVGCFTYSACEGHENHAMWGNTPLHVGLISEANMAWAAQLLADANMAGIETPDLLIQGDMLREDQVSVDSEQRDLHKVRQQAVALGRYLYSHRQQLRSKRLSWAEQYQPPVTQDVEKDSEHRLTEGKPRRFRVRLVDADDYAIEFTIDNYKTLEVECRKALKAWLLLRRDSAPAHVSIRAAKLETTLEWKTPWGDSKPVWLKVSPVEAKQRKESELKILTRRRAKSKSDSRETSWLLLWMGIREAFPEDFVTT
ncbi:hypothetical protein B0D71_18430 [Pseudomonas laurylsulfativorans]|jgi:hypothetical protein|uniref:Uncharacterized protein n=1 Tax=Pseudomonas laurylsulfativorans TaxID=1943631 RepID=A0A2S3VNJ3_9PSED|nr:hypothetical protein [Pseudomonas laurylsulfativorans]POF41209.1 hypothetical protein B0D71_18430 [Pseudomonas laurylsulfativorans]